MIGTWFIRAVLIRSGVIDFYLNTWHGHIMSNPDPFSLSTQHFSGVQLSKYTNQTFEYRHSRPDYVNTRFGLVNN